MRLIVDRIESGYLVCEKEDRSVINLNLNDYEIPEEISEGDSIFIRNNIIYLDYDHTEKIKKDLSKQCENMWDE